MSPERNKLETDTIEAEISSPEASLVERGFFPARLFASFKYRDYRFFLGGALLSNIGTWMQTIALGWVVYAMTKSPFYVGLVNFSSNVPVFFIVLVAGVFADRLDRKGLIVWTQVPMMIFAFILAILATFHRLTIPLIIIFTLGTGISFALNFPAWQAIISDIVPRKDLLNAIALNSAQFHTSRFIGPALAGVVFGIWGAATNFYLNGFSFLAVILAMLVITPHKVEKLGRQEGILSPMREGFRYVGKQPVIINLLAVTGLLTLFGMPYVTLMPIFAREKFGFGATGYGFLLGVNGFGALVGALIVAYLATVVRRENLIKIGAIGFGTALVLFALSRSILLSTVLLVAAGGSFLITTSAINTSLQSLVSGKIRGRIMSLFIWMFLGMMPFSSLIAGAVAEKLGVPLTVVIGGSIVLLIGLILTTRPSLIKQPAEPPD